MQRNHADSLLAAAIARRDAALAEARRWDAWITAAQELIAATPNATASVMPPQPRGGDAARPTTKARGDAVGERVLATEAVAAEIIRELGRPVPTREMLELMAARGLRIVGKVPSATLQTRLSRAPSIENHRPYGWRLKEPQQEIGAAGNAPPADPANSDPETPSSPVEPAAGGGT